MSYPTTPFVPLKLPKAPAKLPITPVNAKAELDNARRKYYAALDAKERKEKLNAEIEARKKLAAVSTKLQKAKAIEEQKNVAKNTVPNHLDKSQVITEYNKAVGHHLDVQSEFKEAKKNHQIAKKAVASTGGRRRRRRQTRPKRKKSKQRGRKRHTKKRRKRHTKKRRKRYTKKRRRSRRI